MKRMLTIVIAAMSLSAYGQATSNQSQKAGLPARIETQPRDGALPSTSRTVLGIVVGKHTLAEVQRHLGKAAIWKMDREEGRPKVVCYRSRKVGDDTVVLFEAGPLGGFQTTTAVVVGPNSAFDSLPSDCLATARVSRATATAGRLRLGGNLESFRDAMKAHSGAVGDGLAEFPFERTLRRKDKSTGKEIEIDVSSGFVARVDNAAVKWFVVYYTESL